MTDVSLAKMDWVIDFADETSDDYFLHAPTDDMAAYLDDDYRDPLDIAGTVLCGREGRAWGIAGILSRMEKDRCPACCERSGLPPGVGAPKNDDACRAVLGLPTTGPQVGQ